MTNRMRSRPPTPPTVDDFIAGEQNPAPEPKGEKRKPAQRKVRKAATPRTAYPWRAAEVRSDVLKTYNLRLPEPYMLKLRFIADHTPESMQKFCLSTLIPAIDEEVERITKKSR